jgi:hypothetical protein
MTRLASRLLYPATLAVLLTALVPLMASAWSTGNSCGSSTFKICVSIDDGNGVPRAVTNYSDSTYVSDKYPNTQWDINNSISSMQNWYSNRDVTFFHDYNYGGTAMCVDSLYGYTSISFVHDDTFSSHRLETNDGVC